VVPYTSGKIWPDLCVDMSLHSDILSWFRDNKSLPFPFNVVCLAEKQPIPILYSLLWPDRPWRALESQTKCHKKNRNICIDRSDFFFRSRFHELNWENVSFIFKKRSVVVLVYVFNIFIVKHIHENKTHNGGVMVRMLLSEDRGNRFCQYKYSYFFCDTSFDFPMLSRAGVQLLNKYWIMYICL
jgi:hypothetical protein